MWNIFKNKKKIEEDINKINELVKEYDIEFNYIMLHVKKYIEKIKNNELKKEGTYIIDNINTKKYDAIYAEISAIKYWNAINGRIIGGFKPLKLEEHEFYFKNWCSLYKYTVKPLNITLDGELKWFIELKIEKGIQILDKDDV